MGEMFLKGAEVTIKIVEFDQKDPVFGVLLVVLGYVPDQLQAHRGFPGTFWAENHSRRGLLRVANDLAPGRVECAGNAEFAENRVSLSVLVRKRIASQLVVSEEFLFSHDSNSIVKQQRKTRSHEKTAPVLLQRNRLKR